MAHLHVHECGALELSAGAKVIALPTPDGKLTPEQVFAHAPVREAHHRQSRVVSITQATELGTVYSVSELGAIARAAHDLGLYLHVDGARICNAAAALGGSLRATTVDAGVDVLSFGGTKNGLLGGEAVVFFRPELAEHARFVRMQQTQLASKMRFIAAQFLALLEGDLWLDNARHSNAMARRLADAVSAIPAVRITQKVETNAVFAALPDDAIPTLQAEFPFYTWDDRSGEVRWMCSWDTTEGDVDAFAARIAEVTRNPR
jgi:threonine aldolase